MESKRWKSEHISSSSPSADAPGEKCRARPDSRAGCRGKRAPRSSGRTPPARGAPRSARRPGTPPCTPPTLPRIMPYRSCRQGSSPRVIASRQLQFSVTRQQSEDVGQRSGPRRRGARSAAARRRRRGAGGSPRSRGFRARGPRRRPADGAASPHAPRWATVRLPSRAMLFGERCLKKNRRGACSSVRLPRSFSFFRSLFVRF